MPVFQTTSITPLRLSEQDEVALHPRPAKKMDRIKVLITFMNSCLGSGVLALGVILHTEGLIPYIIYQVLSVLFSLWQFYIITKADYHGNFATLSDAVRCLWGKGMGLAVDISIVGAMWGFLTAYVSVSSDYIRDGIQRLANVDKLGNDTWRRLFKLFTSIIALGPLSMITNVDSLSFVSSFAIVFVLLAVFGIVLRYCQFEATDFTKFPPKDIPHHQAHLAMWPDSGKDWRKTIGYFTTFFTLYTMHSSIPPMQRQIAGKPKHRYQSINFASFVAVPLCCIIYTVACILASKMFNKDCTGMNDPKNICIPMNSNILLSFQDDTMMTVFKLLYSIVILVSFPTIMFPMRESIASWFQINRLTKKGYFYYAVIGWAITLLCCVLSIAIPAIDDVFGITSNLFGIILMELAGIYVWYKLPLLEKDSFGELLEKNIELSESALTEETSEAIQSFVDGIEQSAKLEGSNEKKPKEHAIETADVHQETDIVDKQTVEVNNNEKRHNAKQAKFVDKYVKRGLYKQKFDPPLWRKIILYASSVFFVCFNITAIVFQFV